MARAAAGALTFPAGIAVGTGVGGAVAGALAPRLRGLENESWRLFKAMPLASIQAAQAVASGERTIGWGIEEASNNGVNEDRFRALVDVVDTAPDLSTLYELLHRKLISQAAFREGARKQYIEAEWVDALLALAEKVLTPAEVAQAWQRGYISEQAAEAEAALSGVDAERSRIQRESAGLPPPPETALQMLRRGIINSAEFEQMIREGNTKTKYTDEYLQLEDRILSGPEWAGLWLRGWVTEEQAKAGGALDGWDAAAMERLYENRGRPATTRQVHIGYARGGALPGAANEREAFETAVKQSNIRTEYSDLLWHSRYTYPSAFVVRGLTEDGTFSEADARRILTESGWPPEFADKAAAKWAGATTAGPGSKWADRARGRLFTAAHSDYLDGNADEADARAMLQAVGVGAAEQDTVLNLWNLERSRTRRDLTQAQILKLVKKTIWQREQGQAALEDIGMDAGDASDLLDTI